MMDIIYDSGCASLVDMTSFHDQLEYKKASRLHTSTTSNTMSIRRTFQAQPTSEEVLKRVEKSIVKEAKSEEKNLKHTIKDLTAAEKLAQKAHKVFKSLTVRKILTYDRLWIKQNTSFKTRR